MNNTQWSHWFFYLSICVLQAWYLFGAKAHISVVYYNPTSSEWEILLGRNTGTSVWDDFDTTFTSDIVTLGQEGLHKQTLGAYNKNNASLKNISPVVLYEDQYFFIVPVKIKLYIRKKNRFKTAFTWIRVNDLVGPYDIIKNPIKRRPERITVEPGYRFTFKKLWSDKQKAFESSTNTTITTTANNQENCKTN
jgi:hypothetical protein